MAKVQNFSGISPDLPFTGVLAPVGSKNEGPKMKKGAPKRSRRYKKMGSIGKITGTVCRLTHDDGIKRQSLNKELEKLRNGGDLLCLS